ncbi:capsule assembly Wzi family protein [Mucilaginibacter sp. RB4R14]|uniref:capsule assembly Wzi family protein n=1 Tax=Mucilaginibacter aurantiaciroseus TaxID=2949308 RepID=UPI002091DD03|nr:capsule assembly Wzi family protein [Mucilaginibacter aurantiaciroseus]MCO5936297.1 capsule assembly Wzi family protein [Mucilaginibacter aurantiaciroseus]
MQKNYTRLAGKVSLLLCIIMLSVTVIKAQSVYLPQSYQFYQKFNADVYSKGSSMHTALRPFLIDSTLQGRYDQLMNVGVDSSRKNWFLRKLFNEHLIAVKARDFTFYGDILLENTFGHDFNDKTTTPVNFKPIGFGPNSRIGLNTRGFQFGGTVGTKFSFYTSAYENQAAFPNYFTDYVKQISFIPGQAYDRLPAKSYRDYSYATAILSYTPSKYLNFTLGQDKTFIGDGYRSILLSDNTAPAPLLRVTANVGNVQYMIMWTYMQDHNLPKFDTFGNNRRKWGLFHYLDWNVNKSLSLGFFNAYIAPEADAKGNRRGFDVNFINPILFSSSLGPSSQPGNALVGFTGKYKIFDKTAIYGQFLIDRFKGDNFFKSNNTDNTNGFQLGIRGADLAGVKDLNYLLEYNTVKPYTYSNTNALSAYTYYSQPLGDPFGANFRELTGIMNYSAGRFDFQGQLMYAKYGLDAAGDNNGKDVTKPYAPTLTTNTVGQGIGTNLYYAEGTVSFMVNPKYNMRLELNGIYRRESNTLATKNATIISFGLRSSFRNLYHDF